MKNKLLGLLLISILLGSIGIYYLYSQNNTNNSSKDSVMSEKNPLGPILLRKDVFGNPDKRAVSLSPNAEYISFIAPNDGVLNIWVAAIKDKSKVAAAASQANVITKSKKRPITDYFWTYDSKKIIYALDNDGDENHKLYQVDLSSGRDSLLFERGKKAKVIILGSSPQHPDKLIVGVNDRNPQFYDPYLLDLNNGKALKLLENDKYSELIFDRMLNLRFGNIMNEEGNTLYKLSLKNSVSHEKLPDQAPWGDKAILEAAKYLISDEKVNKSENTAKKEAAFWEIEQVTLFEKIPMDDVLNTGLLSFNKESDALYWADSRGQNTSSLYFYKLAEGEKHLLLREDKVDIDQVFLNPVDFKPIYANVNYTKNIVGILDPNYAEDFAYLASLDPQAEISFNCLDNQEARYAIVVMQRSDKPVSYYFYDRKSKKAEFLFTNRPKLEKYKLANMYPVVLKSRDGLDMVSYLTLPSAFDETAGKAEGVVANDYFEKVKTSHALPMVLNVHGGPNHRDTWGLSNLDQWLANRGYAVLSVNYRGSTGFGKRFLNAGHGEWSRKMHDDLIDAVEWAVKAGIADPHKVAIFGGSYGGYAALVGLTFTPEFFTCAIDIVGVSNLETLYNTMPEYWKPAREHLKLRLGGDTESEAGRAALRERSPLTFVERIKKPLLIGHGANDPRVKQAESEQIVTAMNNKGIPVTYVLFPDEGHGFARPENSQAFFAIAELFLSNYLKGRYQPITDELKPEFGSSAQIREYGDLLELKQHSEAK